VLMIHELLTGYEPISYPMVNLKVILESFPRWQWSINAL